MSDKILNDQLKQSVASPEDDWCRRLLEISRVGLFKASIQEGRFLYVNEAFSSMLGYASAARLLAQSLCLSHLANEKYFRLFWRELNTQGQVNRFEMEIRQSNGAALRLEISAVLSLEGQWIEGTAIDITRHHQVALTLKESEARQVSIKEKLSESEAKYRKLVENATDAIFIAQDECIKFPNRKAVEILGYEDEAPERVGFVEYIHPDDRAMVLDIHRKRLSGIKDLPTTYSFRITNRRGVAYVLQLSAVVIEWEGRLATLNFVRDITEQKRLEKSLQQAHKMDAIGTLAGGIAHDFNNLLMGIQGHASLMLLDVFPSSPFFAHLKGIENYVRSAAELTSQLLGFARGGKYEVKPLNLNQLIDESSQLFGRTKKEISIRKIFDARLWVVEADRQQIEQVLFNIYVNAWQAMPTGGSIYLQTTNAVLDEHYVKPFQITPGRYAKITITDTGIGMDKATQEKIFEPFFTTKAMGRGTGLGMASAYGIIKNHNGVINVYSEKGKGTTFTIYLPASTKSAFPDDERTPKPLTGGETILLVDDESLILDVGRQMIRKLGYTVYAAESGMKALELYQKYGHQIGLVILDMIMPGMNGDETFDRLKGLNAEVKVLLSSGYSINGDASTILERGCNGFIQKPFNLIELSQKIREILDAPA